MTIRTSLAIAALLTAVSANVHASEQLLATYMYIAGQNSSWHGVDTFTHVKFYPVHYVVFEEPLALGEPETPWWYNGQSGTFEFTPATATNFDAFGAMISDGQDHSIRFVAELTTANETVHTETWRTRPESQVFRTDRDLVGYQVTRIHLTVTDVDFWTDGDGWQHMEAWLRWQFWGVPGPDLGDLNCDLAIDAYDIDPFILAVSSCPDFDAYHEQYPDCNPLLADINGDGSVNAYDIDGFVALVGD